ncbi:30S ribosomal protein S8 [Chlorobium phaeovibrioides]|uniref:Small ribosomal subunit protein uS8 n=2 Tax=Chlorobium phaeovibrioides TaxID=1094 RepID=RS8_CHLPM|nr:30S ribosomal protein S8 [Chlorobium phaeovibrioides]A4SCS3.1 RecName: Full=Small ribosomal subunit protein uS8; AltName: Full=30S ribosomal protein S8 [Chlorobium phaeovibrioides DSM 265]HCD36584.1 30S ribosomal protein S8 [Chlorobium sp.]KAA6231908.1 30S ribosomal protein S8 [Chlorobium phaeovibrioides]MWV53528.1 30S ribosomal protein S8 [Chlorobium phaeovibrioides]QEQ57540.1 30S ribosomal protein S8 [Chlorobium phaeovibrioides]RTY36169.1 30S ribosomal protein S8 [Chlorobium phaeovibrioi
MPVTDSIADYITRLRNAGRAKNKTTDIPYSKLRENISQLLLEKGYIKGFTVITTEKFPFIRVEMKYTAAGVPSIKEITRVSRPGRRMYEGKDIKKYLGGLGLYIISTSKGVITDKEAREQGVGGEILFRIY